MHTERLAEAGIAPSVDSVERSYDIFRAEKATGSASQIVPSVR